MKPAITLTSLDYARLDRVVHLAQAQGQDVAGLESELLRADIVEPRSVRPDVVTMNSRVRFTFEPEAEEFEYVLSYPWDADKTDVPRLSVLTPVGSALLGLRVGQRIDWQVPGGRKLRLHVIELPWQPESNGEDLGEQADDTEGRAKPRKQKKPAAH